MPSNDMQSLWNGRHYYHFFMANIRGLAGSVSGGAPLISLTRTKRTRWYYPTIIRISEYLSPYFTTATTESIGLSIVKWLLYYAVHPSTPPHWLNNRSLLNTAPHHEQFQIYLSKASQSQPASQQSQDMEDLLLNWSRYWDSEIGQVNLILRSIRSIQLCRSILLISLEKRGI